MNKLFTIILIIFIIILISPDMCRLIEKFETKYQLGEERKLDYNPIEIYLKIQNLYKQLSGKPFYSKDSVDKDSIKKIYSWIGNYKTIEKEK